MVSLVKLLGDIAVIISIKTHLRCALGFNECFGLYFLFVGDIWYDVQKGYGSILSPISCQKIILHPDINDLLDMCPNLRCNNSKANFFLGDIFFDFDICFIFPKNACFRSSLCGEVTAFFSL